MRFTASGLAFGFQTRSGSLRLVDAHLVIRRFSANPSDPSQKGKTNDKFPSPHREKNKLDHWEILIKLNRMVLESHINNLLGFKKYAGSKG